MAFGFELQARVVEDDAGEACQLLACELAKGETASIEEDIAHVDDETAFGITCVEDCVELLKQAGAKFSLFAGGLFGGESRLLGGLAGHFGALLRLFFAAARLFGTLAGEFLIGNGAGTGGFGLGTTLGLLGSGEFGLQFFGFGALTAGGLDFSFEFGTFACLLFAFACLFLLLAALGFGLGLCAGAGLSFLCGATFVREPLFIHPPESDDARVLKDLDGVARCHLHRLAIIAFARLIALGILQFNLSLGPRFDRVFVDSKPLPDPCRIACLIDFERQLRVDTKRLEDTALVFATFEQLVLGIDRFDLAEGFGKDGIFDDDHLAWHGDCEVGLCRQDKAE